MNQSNTSRRERMYFAAYPEERARRWDRQESRILVMRVEMLEDEVARLRHLVADLVEAGIR